MSEVATRERILETSVIAVVRGVEKDAISDVVDAIAAGGVKAIEITVDTPDAIEIIHQLSSDYDDILIGAGTVLDSETARGVQLVGADFIVTPTVDTEVIELCNRYDTHVIAGVMTPTEALTATEAGADMCKLFPASTVGSGHLSSINGPLPQIPIVPTGGVSLDNAPEFFEAGAVAIGVGSSLVDSEAIEAGDYQTITETAAEFVSIAEEYR